MSLALLKRGKCRESENHGVSGRKALLRILGKVKKARNLGTRVLPVSDSDCRTALVESTVRRNCESYLPQSLVFEILLTAFPKPRSHQSSISESTTVALIL